MQPGASLRRYQRAFASCLGVQAAYAFWKGRVAWYAILRALGIGVGDEVILPGYTCVMAVNPVVYLGARPVFVDIEPITYNIDPQQIQARISTRTRLIVAQHTYGYPAAMEEISAIAERAGVPVVEDCCLSLGSRYGGRMTGTLGLAAYFSFQWNKPYTSGLGGMAVTSDGQLAARLEALQAEAIRPRRSELAVLAAQLGVYRALVYPKTTALAQNAFRWATRAGLAVGSSSTEEFSPTMPFGFFKGMTDLQARCGYRQLERLDQSIVHRRGLTRLYDRLLSQIGWPLPKLPHRLDPVLVRYPVRVTDKSRALAEAAAHFVELGSWFECPLHPRETPMEAYGYHQGMCPEAERASRQVVNLPVHPRADEATARRTVEFIAKIGPASSDG
jgi:perosamine synthetase